MNKSDILNLLIIHFLPENLSACGGIKVHYDLSEIELELGIESIIAFPSRERVPQWMSKRNIGKILSYREAQEFAYFQKKSGKKIIIIGTEDASLIDMYFCDDFIKVCYIQGHVFWDPFNNNYNNKVIVTISNLVSFYIKKEKTFVINPFIRRDIFYPLEDKKILPNKDFFNVVIQKRKGGNEFLGKLLKVLYQTPSKYSEVLLGKVKFHVINEQTEIEFAKTLREADLFISHSYPEGFGLPSLEAMASKTLVVGFSGGGEAFMTEDNSFIVDDGNIESLADTIFNVLFLIPKNQLEVIVLNAYKKAISFSKERTTEQFLEFLKEVV